MLALFHAARDCLARVPRVGEGGGVDEGAPVARESHPAGTVLFRQGEAGEKAYYIDDGRVSIVQQDETIAVVGAGDIFGEMALIDDRPRTASAVCATDCRLLAVTRDYLHDVMGRADPALPFILRVVLQRFRSVMAPGEGSAAHVPARPGDHLDGPFSERLHLEESLRSALDEGHFFLVAQPIVELDSGRTAGIETLVRVDHPEHGVLAPRDFLALAEERGLIVDIGCWALQESARIARDHVPEDCFVSVNVAPRQLGESDLAQVVADACRDAGLAPGRLVLEVTEMGIVEQPEHAAELLHRVSALGCRVAIDDFGTGTSSFSQLHRLPFDMLKIDRTLIAALPESERARKMVRAICRMADELELAVVAEGIENTQISAQADAAGCALGQGYYLGKPESPAGRNAVS